MTLLNNFNERARKLVVVFATTFLVIAGSIPVLASLANATENTYKAYQPEIGVFELETPTGARIPAYSWDRYLAPPLTGRDGVAGYSAKPASPLHNKPSVQSDDGLYTVYSSSNLSTVDGKILTTSERVRKILFNGYPTDAAGIQQKYGLSNREFQGVTQLALWDALEEGNENHSVLTSRWSKKGKLYNVYTLLSTFKARDGLWQGQPDTLYGPADRIGQGIQLQAPPAEFQVEVLSSTEKVLQAGVKMIPQRMGFIHYAVSPVISFKKVDSANQPLANVQLRISEWSNGAAGTQVDEWTSTADAHSVDFGEITGTKEYVFSEVQALPGYVKAADIRFQLRQDESKHFVLSTWDEQTNSYVNERTVDETTSLTMVNRKEMVTVKFVKQDNDGAPVDGAKFTVVPAGNQYDELTSFTSDVAGTPQAVSLEKLGEYVLKETKVPLGYRKIRDVAFTVNAAGNFEIRGDARDDVQISGDTVTLKNQKSDAPLVTVSKVDSFDKSLPGARMRLCVNDANVQPRTANGVERQQTSCERQNDNSWNLVEWTTTEEPQVIEIGEFPGNRSADDLTFILEEVQAPAGYENKQLSVTFKINANKQLHFDEADAYNGFADDANVEAIENTQRNVIFDKVNANHIKVVNRPDATQNIDLIVKKVDAGKKQVKIRNVQNVSIWDIFEKDEQFPVSDTNPDEPTPLPPGAYILRENTAPRGYVKAEKDIKFELTTTGTVKLLSNPENLASVEDKTIYLVNHKATPELYIEKVGPDGLALNGANFTITNLADPQDTHQVAPDTTTGKNPFKLEVKAGRYQITETTTPDGYETLSPVVFEMRRDGSVEIQSKGLEDNVTVEAGTTGSTLTNKVKLTNQKAKKQLTIAKVNESNQPLAGVGFALYSGETANNDNLVNAWTTTDGNTQRQLKLKAGTYTLKETATPKGYASVEPFTITIPEDGDITTTGPSHLVSVAGTTLTVKNLQAKHDIWISKTNPLSDAITATLQILSGETGETPAAVVDAKYAPLADGTFTTSDTDATLIHLDVGTYRLREKQAPQGYAAVNDVPFTVDEYGQITLGTITAGDQVSAEGNLLTVVDKPTGAFDVAFSKQNVNGAEISGAALEIKKTDSGAPQTVAAWITQEGETHTVPLTAGNYTLRELSAPNGYRKVADVNFTVGPDGAVTLPNGNTQEAKIADGKLIVTDEFEPVTPPAEPADGHTYTFKKQNLDGELLSGAIMQIFTETGNTLTDEWQTSDQPHTRKLANGTYVLVEKVAPAYFRKINRVTFTVTDGTIQVTDNGGNTSEQITAAGDTLTVKDRPTGRRKRELPPHEFTITKVGPKNETVLGANLEIRVLTDGAEGDVATDKNGEQLSWTTEATAKTIALKMSGSYRLKETSAPAPYSAISAIDFTVNENSVQVTSTTVTGGSATVTEDGNLVVTDNYDLPTYFKEIIISKQANTTEAVADRSELAGATLQILEEDGTTPAHIFDTDDTAIADSQWETGTQKTVKILPGTYTLKEITSPAGYAVAQPFLFTVGANGHITVAEEDKAGNIIHTSTNKLTLVNQISTQAKEVVFVKKAAADASENLPGATFQILTEDGNAATVFNTADQKVSHEWVTTKEVATFKLLPGTYKLRETQAPAGFARVGDVTFTVGDDGAVAVVDHAGGVSAAGNQLTVVDSKDPATFAEAFKKVVISKKVTLDSTGELSGATVEVWNASTGDQATTDFEADAGKTRATVFEAGSDEDPAAGGLIANSSWVSGAEPKTVRIPAGVYWYHETAAPNGYAVVTAIKFEVTAEGSVKLLEVNGAVVPEGTARVNEPAGDKAEAVGPRLTVAANANTATISSSFKDVVVSKKAALNASEELEGAYLQVLNQDGSVAAVFEKHTTRPAGTTEDTVSYLPVVEGKWISATTAKTLKLAPGTYTLREEKAPAGFATVKPIKFTVTAEGTVTLVEVNGAAVLGGVTETSAADGDQVKITDNTLTIVDKLLPADDPNSPLNPENQTFKTINVSKKTGLDAAEELQGAHLQILNDDAVRSAASVFTADGQHIPGARWISEATARELRILPGTYILIENAAPTGFAKVKEIKFAVSEDGKVKLLHVNGQDVAEGETKVETAVTDTSLDSVEATENTLTVVDKVLPQDSPERPAFVNVKIVKKASLLIGPDLSGAHLQILNDDAVGSAASIFTANGEHIPGGTWISGVNPTEIQITPGNYIFREVKAPIGFLAVKDFTFTVSEEGTITVTNANGNSLEVKESTLFVVDPLDPDTAGGDTPGGAPGNPNGDNPGGASDNGNPGGKTQGTPKVVQPNNGSAVGFLPFTGANLISLTLLSVSGLFVAGGLLRYKRRYR